MLSIAHEHSYQHGTFNTPPLLKKRRYCGRCKSKIGIDPRSQFRSYAAMLLCYMVIYNTNAGATPVAQVDRRSTPLYLQQTLLP